MARFPALLVLVAVTLWAPMASAERPTQPPAARAPATPITKAAVAEMRDQITAAVRKRDAAAVVAYLAPDAKIRMVLPSPSGMRNIDVTVPQYRQMLEQAWAQVDVHTYEVRDLRVKVRPGGSSALVTDTVLETVEANGQVLRTRTQEVMAVERRGGRMVITSITGTLQP